jgi:glutamate--glyoxylate aminotransferase
MLAGAYGECGLRGGYMELHNMDPDVLDELYKIASINLSPNTPGQVSKVMEPDFDTDCITHKSQCHMMSLDSQISLGLMVNPPKQGDASYVQFMKEKDGLLNSLKRRARKMTDAFNALEGVSCQETEGDICVTTSLECTYKSQHRI